MTLGTLLEHPFHFKGAFGKKMSHKKFEALKMTFSAPSQSQKLKKRAKNDQKQGIFRALDEAEDVISQKNPFYPDHTYDLYFHFLTWV